MPCAGKYIRWIHELTFSAYVGFLIFNGEVGKQHSAFLDWLVRLLDPLYRILAYVGPWVHFYPGLGSRWATVWLLLAAIVFIGLRSLRRNALAREILRYVTGVAAVAAFPVYWLKRDDVVLQSSAIARFLGVPRDWPDDGLVYLSSAENRWLWLAVALVAVYVIVYLRKTSLGVTLCGAVVLAMHCWIWAALASRGTGLSDWRLVCWLLGVFACLAWGVYVRTPSQACQRAEALSANPVPRRPAASP